MNEKFPVSFVTCTVQYIKGIKFLIGVWQDIWHNGEGSVEHKSRRFQLTLQLTSWKLVLIMDVLLEYYNFRSF